MPYSRPAGGANLSCYCSNTQPFGRLSNLVSELTSFGHMDVYSMTRESLQRMLPREAAQAPAAPQEIRLFQYRFSKAYLASLPAGQRPVEREVFGESDVRRAFVRLTQHGRSLSVDGPAGMAWHGLFWRSELRECRAKEDDSASSRSPAAI